MVGVAGGFGGEGGTGGFFCTMVACIIQREGQASGDTDEALGTILVARCSAMGASSGPRGSSKCRHDT